MRTLPVSYSMLVYLDELEYTEAALAADPDAASLAPTFTALIAEWPTIFNAERGARRDVTRSDALVAVSDVLLDRITLRFSEAVLVEAGGSRDSNLYRRFFSVTPGKFVRAPFRKQCEATRDVVLVEVAKLPSVSPLLAYQAKIQSANTAGLASLDKRSAAKGARSSNARDVEDWKAKVNASRTTAFAELLKIAAAKGYPKAWADTFYHPAPKKAATDQTDDGTDGAENTGTSTSTPANGSSASATATHPATPAASNGSASTSTGSSSSAAAPSGTSH